MTRMTRLRAQRSIERRTEGSVTEYLAFRVASTKYALPVAVIREIARTAHVTPVPRAPSAVLGIMSFRGRVVTVIDVARQLDLACSVIPSSPTRLGGARMRVLMADIQGETLGLVVDEVLTVHRLANRDIERPSTAVGSDVGAQIIGIARERDDDEIIQLLEAKALVP